MTCAICLWLCFVWKEAKFGYFSTCYKAICYMFILVMCTFRKELVSRILLSQLAVLVFILPTHYTEFQGVDLYLFKMCTLNFRFVL